MAFNPLLPLDDSLIEAPELRGQFTGLFAMIEAIPAGPPGADGAVGPAFTSFVVDSVTTLPALQPATASASFDGTFVRFAFGLPQGPAGTNGLDGATGLQGPQGTPGEVTTADLNNAIAGSAINPSTIAQLVIGISDPPTQSELMQVMAKVNELIAALRR